jgi:DNA-binding MarR family transcriptional regulator
MLGRILNLLDQHGALTVAELSRLTHASPEALSGMLDTLARRGLVDWQRDPAGGDSERRGAAPMVTLSLMDNKNPRQDRG